MRRRSREKISDAVRAAMQLRANAVELVFDVDRMRFGPIVREARPDCFRRRFRTGQHALDRTEQ